MGISLACFQSIFKEKVKEQIQSSPAIASSQAPKVKEQIQSSPAIVSSQAPKVKEPLQSSPTIASSQAPKVEEQIQSSPSIVSSQAPKVKDVKFYVHTDFNTMSVENFKMICPDHVLTEKELKWLTNFCRSDYIPTEYDKLLAKEGPGRGWTKKEWSNIVSDPVLLKKRIFWSIQYLSREAGSSSTGFERYVL